MPAATSSLIESNNGCVLGLVPGRAYTKDGAAFIGRILEDGVRVALVVKQRDHCLVELAVLVCGVVGSERGSALFCVGRLLPVGRVALAIGALAVPMRPVAVSTARVPLVPG
eukprot:3723748-Pleurochrysis_carterae.AAC.1